MDDLPDHPAADAVPDPPPEQARTPPPPPTPPSSATGAVPRTRAATKDANISLPEPCFQQHTLEFDLCKRQKEKEVKKLDEAAEVARDRDSKTESETVLSCLVRAVALGHQRLGDRVALLWARAHCWYCPPMGIMGRQNPRALVMC